ncbi:MAG: dihydroorotase [Candidatus Edwardsbacteria bacterium]
MPGKGQILLKNGRVIDPVSGRDEVANILIEDGKIKEIGALENSKNSEVIDISGKVVIPGLIDMHTHLREPGREDEETIATGSKAAVRGGFTTVCCMPNTEPPIDDQSKVKFILERASACGLIDVFPIAAISKGRKGEELTEIGELLSAGAVAISDDGLPVRNSALMRRALEYSRMFDIPVISHCEDLDLSAEGVMNEGFVSTSLGLRGIPHTAEEIMVARDCFLAELTNSRLHLAHLSTAGSVEIVRQAKKKGIKVTCETAPHYFTLTDESVRSFETNFKVNPPLRSKEDVLAIIEGLKDGTIDVIATDHAPHTSVEKEVEFDQAPPGIIGLETAFSLALTELVKANILTLSEVVAKLSFNPAKILKLSVGEIKVGAPADLTIVDLNREWIVQAKQFASKSKNSAFIGRELKGQVIMVIKRGKITEFWEVLKS